MTASIQPGDWLEGPFWQGTVQILHIAPHTGYDVVSVFQPAGGPTRPVVLTPVDWANVRRVSQADHGQLPFTGDPQRFRLGIQALRLWLAHSLDPYAGLNASRIDPLPHQFEAVYEHLLARPVVRALLAHDAGAGKTIMAGLLIKELKRRQGIGRVLIVAPATLTTQWRRELLTKFGEDFTVVSREYLDQERLDSLDVWRETNFALTSVAYARQKNIRRALEATEWDLVIVDEAHKLAAYRRPNGSIVRTQAYELGEVLSRRATHFLLMTATPHKGDPENYRLLIQLVDPQWGDALAHGPGPNPVVLRRTKEEMRKADGDKLYPDRIVDTIPFNLSASEGELLEQVLKVVKKRFERAKALNRQSAAFALIMLSRRLASSPYALKKSLENMRAAAMRRRRMTEAQDGENIEDWDDLTESERWTMERRAEESAAELLDVKQIDHLIERTQALIARGDQQKIRELENACRLWVKERGEQLIVFTEFKATLDHLLDRLQAWEISATCIHGGMELNERRQAEKEFWAGKARVLVATEAAGEGINLQCCHVMVNFDLPWNPTRLEQRMGRIHRYGQKAPVVYIFNLLARNSMEDEVKQALLDKLKQMRKDLGDKVFDVVGEVLLSQSLRAIFDRLALGEADAMEQARQMIDGVEPQIRRVIETEKQVGFTSNPLDVANFQRKQSTFRALRLSPEAAEDFFRQAIPVLGGALKETRILTPQGNFPAFQVVLPPEIAGRHAARLAVSFWSPVCSDDDTDPAAVLFISPGHWLFEMLIQKVAALCQPDLERGAVFYDLHPDTTHPYLVWFANASIQDGRGRRMGELLAALRHQADVEQVHKLPAEVLDGFAAGAAPAAKDAIHQVQPMLAAQEAVLEQCLNQHFLPALQEHKERAGEVAERDFHFLEAGLNELTHTLTATAFDAFVAGDETTAAHLTGQAEMTSQRLLTLQDEYQHSKHVLLHAPQTLGVALVLPAPIKPTEEERKAGVPAATMRRDDRVATAAMQIVLTEERVGGRFPVDVHEGKSWDIESLDAQGNVIRYIEVKGRGPEDANEVSLTDPEWNAARRLGDQHWLYIVRLADQRIWRIQNPVEKLHPKASTRWLVKLSDLEGL